MAVYHDARCRLCRREGMKLFLKGARCLTDKCAIERRGYAPGEHGKSRRAKETNYGRSCARSRRPAASTACSSGSSATRSPRPSEAKGVTGEVLLQMLERRLDNVVFRLGFAPSRSAARQLVRHRHFTVNGRTVDIPSFQVQAPGDEIQVRDKSRELVGHQELARGPQGSGRAGLGRPEHREALGPGAPHPDARVHSRAHQRTADRRALLEVTIAFSQREACR